MLVSSDCDLANRLPWYLCFIDDGSQVGDPSHLRALHDDDVSRNVIVQ